MRKPITVRAVTGQTKGRQAQVRLTFDDIPGVLADMVYLQGAETSGTAGKTVAYDLTASIARAGRLEHLRTNWRIIDPVFGECDIVSVELFEAGLIPMWRLRCRRHEGTA